MAAFGIAVFAAILFGSLAFETALAVKQPKVTICHVDPDGDGAGNETLEVNGNSLAKHLAHGDGEGACLTCGNGLEEAGEECDAGGSNSDVIPNACRTTCQLATCGDSVVDTAEQCDDGNNDNGDGCDAVCVVEFCGDGDLNNSPNEQCDDGNNVNGDGCDAFCQVEDLCGNEEIDAGEECDGSNLNNMTCEDIEPNGFNLDGNLQGNFKGYPDGRPGLSCNADCTFNTSLCLLD